MVLLFQYKYIINWSFYWKLSALDMINVWNIGLVTLLRDCNSELHISRQKMDWNAGIWVTMEMKDQDVSQRGMVTFGRHGLGAFQYTMTQRKSEDYRLWYFNVGGKRTESEILGGGQRRQIKVDCQWENSSKKTESEAKREQTAASFCFRLCSWYVPF